MNRLRALVCLLACTVPAAAAMASELSRDELKIWNDPAFQRQFIESYMSETEIEPRVTSDEREKMLKVLEHISSDQMEKAVALLLKNRGGAASAVFDFTLATILFQREVFDEAVAVYQVAVEKYPKFRRAWKNLGLCYIQQTDWENALPALTKVIELGGGDALTYGLLGYAYSNAENHLSAESAYRMANLLEPDVMDWKMGLARSFFKQERFGEAVALTNQLIKDQPRNADLWLLQANAYIGLNQPSRAAENYEIVDRLGQSTPQSLNMLADIYINEDLFDLAVPMYIRAMEMNTQGKPDRAMRAARVLVARGAYDETRELINKIESLFSTQIEDDDRKELLKLRSRLAVAEGAGEEEARVLEEIVALDPLDGEALILLGQHSFKNGEFEKAIFYFERAASLDAFEAEANVRKAQVLVRQEKYAEAVALLKAAQQIEPRDNVQRFMEQVERIAKSRR
jgi:tetratricopeptide (TPR) repeat protein